MKVLILFLIVPAICITDVYGEHIFDNRQAFAEFLDTIKSSSDKYDIEIDGVIYEIYYGYEGSMEVNIKESVSRIDPKLVSMDSDIDSKSLKVELEPAPKSSIFWLLLPNEFIYAENEEYGLFVDGKETSYDLTKFPTAYAIGMTIPAGATHVEVIGTYMVPEFGSIVILVLAATVTGIVLFFKKSILFFPDS